MAKHSQFARIGVIGALLVIALLGGACSSGDDTSSLESGGEIFGLTDSSQDTSFDSPAS